MAVFDTQVSGSEPGSGSGPVDEPALTLAEYEHAARGLLHPHVWDFIEGGAGAERTLAANRAVFEEVRLRPRLLVGPGRTSIATRLFGASLSAPIGIAPMAFHTLVHSEGEVATVRAAGAAGVPTVVSTFAGRTVEDVAAAASSPWWLQVYVFRDRRVTRTLIERAEAAGARALVLTADAPHLGRRLRDRRNGFRVPQHVVPANLPGVSVQDPQAHARADIDPGLGWDVVGWLREISGLPVVVKGILTAQDAQRALDAGADGVMVSNHGGRQLDAVPSTFEALPEIVQALSGRCPVIVDGGVRGGGDILACLAAGAQAAFVGRPVLHGLAVKGAEGVRGVLEVLKEELLDALTLAGLRALADIGPEVIGRG